MQKLHSDSKSKREGTRSDFPGSPVVKTPPSNAGVQGGKIPHTLGPKHQNLKKEDRSSVVTNSIKTLKMVHDQKKILKKVQVLEQKGQCEDFKKLHGARGPAQCLAHSRALQARTVLPDPEEFSEVPPTPPPTPYPKLHFNLYPTLRLHSITQGNLASLI